MIHRDRLTARLEGGFVVFLIGMRINNPLLIHKWWPVAMNHGCLPCAAPRLVANPLTHRRRWRTLRHRTGY